MPGVRRTDVEPPGTRAVTAPFLPPEIGAVADALRTLDAAHVPWGVAGGWAIDLALGAVTRPHADVDLAVFRDDQHAVRAALPAWRFETVRDGALVPWPDRK